MLKQKNQHSYNMHNFQEIIPKLFDKKVQETVIHLQRKKQSTEVNLKMIQMLKLSDRNI